MERATTRDLQTLFDFLARKAPYLRPVCRWLAVAAELGAERAAVVLLGHARPGTAAELLELLRLLQHKAPELYDTGRWLAEHSEIWQDAWVELQLDQLINADADSWNHPTQILERPRSEFDLLLASCVARRQSAQGTEDDDRLAGVEAKLERAVKIAESARLRRERMRLGRQRRR